MNRDECRIERREQAGLAHATYVSFRLVGQGLSHEDVRGRERDPADRDHAAFSAGLPRDTHRRVLCHEDHPLVSTQQPLAPSVLAPPRRRQAGSRGGAHVYATARSRAVP